MKYQKVHVAIAALLAMGSATALSAEELPVNPPPGAVSKSSGGLYIWGDGPWSKPVNQNGAEQNPEQAVQRAAPPSDVPLNSASTEVQRGAIGYVFPKGTFGERWGSNVRTEFGASQTRANTPGTTGLPQVYNGVALGGCAGCNNMSGTDYSASAFNAKAATDYKVDALTVSPSVSVFSARNHQDFYGPSNSALEWNDTGAKVGVDTKVDVNNQVAVGVGGSYGRAQRSATLGTDNFSTSGSTIPHVANGEAKLTYKPADDLSINGFAGISNYDTKVPGVASSGSSKGIDFAPATNLYYGAGATFRFETK
jgi:hypothetical protein